MRIIDAHVHLYPPETNRDPAGWAQMQGEPAWAEMCTRRRKNGRAVQSFPSVEELLREMDRAGVERSVLLGWYWNRPETCELQNRFYAECVRAHPDRLSAFATFQPFTGKDATLAELRRARSDGLIGLGELLLHSQGYQMKDTAFRDALALAAEWRWPVNLHVTDPNTRDYPGRVETPSDDFIQLAREFPGVNFILAHWGGLLPLRDPAAARLANLFCDTSASPLMYDDSVWRCFFAAVPAERVLFGSDYPLNLFPKLEAAAEMSRFIAEARGAGAPESVLAENAATLLRL